jgi:DNA primase
LAKFSQQFIEQVSGATDIVDLISQYVAIKRRGKEFAGLCPFHDDKRPSLTISPAKQIFKCFACGAGGGVFQFLMLYDKLTFPEAVRALAERARIPIPQQLVEAAARGGGVSKADLLNVNEMAARFFQSQLRLPGGQAAREYLHQRGLSEASVERFGLGYAPPGWDGLLAAARKKGIGAGAMIAAGLAARREAGGCYDRFRHRLMLPIHDPTGRVIAFGGRAMDDSEQAKYLNSAESAVFDKSSSLYGLNWAREAIVASGRAIVTEGYFDVLMPVQAAVRNVVATLGTALTDRHVRVLSRYARDVVLVFDADTAGTAAAERALETFVTQQVQVRIATIPEGNDPCDYVLARGADAFVRLVDEAPDALHYAWGRRQQAIRAAGGSLADRRREVEEFLRLLVTSEAYGAIDEVRRAQLAQHIAHMLNLASADLQRTMQRLSRRVRLRGPAAAAEGAWASNGPTALAQRHVLEVLLNRPDLFAAAEQIGPEDFTDALLRQVATCVWQAGKSRRLSMEHLLATEGLAEKGGALVELLEAGRRRGNHEQTLAAAVEHLLYRRKRREIQELKESGTGDEALRALQDQLRGPDLRRHPRIV